MTIKQLVKTDLIPNPLWTYASYTYAWSLWALSTSDINALMSAKDVSAVNNWNPTTIDMTNPGSRTINTSFVLAEDSGLYPKYRVPGFPINYNIQNVEFATYIAHTKNFRSSNQISGSFKIVEPYGVTFIESMIAASVDPTTKTVARPYTQAPYMLQLEFFGYDDNGNLIDGSIANQIKKRFPIRISKSKIQIGKEGAEYLMDFLPWGHQGHDHITGVTPKPLTITGGTVGEIIRSLESQLNTHYVNDQKNAQNATLADQYKFLIDPAIGTSAIVNNNLTLAQANSTAKTLDFTKKTVVIPANTEILAIIDRVFAQANFLTVDQLQLGTSSSPATNSNATSQGNPINIIRTQVSIQSQGVTNSTDSTPQRGKLDPVRGQFPMLITYTIGQYASYKGESYLAGVLPDSTPLAIKQYDYLYTGKNLDVIDFKMNFDMAYYSAALGYTDAIAATQASKDSASNTLQADIGALKVTPGVLTLGYSAFQSASNLTPLKYKFNVVDANVTGGGGVTSDPNAQKGADVLNSIYSTMTGDMIKVDLTILGDPTFLKQDDWLYIQDPTNATSPYNDWTIPHSKFFTTYGHVRTDIGDLVVTVNINTPVDLDIDAGDQNGGNAGLMFPAPGSRPSIFSGQYKVMSIKNIFKNGAFTQVLSLIRYINTDLIKAYYSQGAANLTKTGQ
jgi:hypothetical protein